MAMNSRPPHKKRRAGGVSPLVTAINENVLFIDVTRGLTPPARQLSQTRKPLHRFEEFLFRHNFVAVFVQLVEDAKECFCRFIAFDLAVGVGVVAFEDRVCPALSPASRLRNG